jgi:putative DNA primase/helicase
MQPYDRSRAVSALLARRAEEVAQHLLGQPSYHGPHEWRWGRRGSLALRVAGERRGQWFDHEAGTGGDLLALVQRERRCTFPEAIAWARAWLGAAAHPLVTAAPDHEAHRRFLRQRQPSPTAELAWLLWCESTPARGTIVERYLASRGLILPEPQDDGCVLRFHPACPRRAPDREGRIERHPAMVALLTDPLKGLPRGLHRTFLRSDGTDRLRDRKGKAMLGETGVVRLSRDDNVTLGLGIAEGIETALSVMQRFGWWPVWAATSAGAIRTFPVLPGVETLTIFADADVAGISAGQTAARRWGAAGRSVRILRPPVGDFNDLVAERAA